MSKGKKQALGRGLSALLKDPDSIISANDKNAKELMSNIVEVDLEDIRPNSSQPRTNFKEEPIKELANSIKELGLIQPITVRKVSVKTYEIISGERRYKASKMIGLTKIPVYIRLADDQESLEMALVENIQREDLDPIEIALTYKRLIEEVNLTQEKLSERVGKKRPTITNYLRLLKLNPIIQSGMRDGFLSMGHGRALINVENVKDQLAIYEKIVKDDISVRKVEEIIQNLNKSNKPVILEEKSAPFANNSISDFTTFFETKVKIKVTGKNKGQIIIPFNSEKDFSKLAQKIQK